VLFRVRYPKERKEMKKREKRDIRREKPSSICANIRSVFLSILSMASNVSTAILVMHALNPAHTLLSSTDKKGVIRNCKIKEGDVPISWLRSCRTA
jgi:hypothetical protein